MQGTLRRLLVNPDIYQAIRVIKLLAKSVREREKALFVVKLTRQWKNTPWVLRRFNQEKSFICRCTSTVTQGSWLPKFE